MADDPQIEVYNPERITEFLLNNAVTAEEWDAAAEEVRRLGLDPANVPNTDPNARAKLMTNAEFDAKLDRVERIRSLENSRSA